jgi:integral membrane sensor domain MASE1
MFQGRMVMSEVKYSALILAWIGAWYLAGIMEYAPYTSLWYLPAGISMAAFIVLGKRALLPIFLAAAVIDPGLRNALTNSFDITELVTGLLFSLVHTSAYAIGGGLARYYFFRLNHGDFPRKTIAILVAFGISSGLAACSGIAVLLFVDRPIMYQPLEGIIVWWLGDLIGCLVFTPLAVIVLSRIWPQFSPPINALVRLSYKAWNNILRYSAKVFLICLFVVLVMTTDAMMKLIEIPFIYVFSWSSFNLDYLYRTPLSWHVNLTCYKSGDGIQFVVSAIIRTRYYLSVCARYNRY